MIYVLKAAEFYKIGYSDVAESRISTLQTGCPHEIELVGVWVGTLEDEKVLHAHFAAKRVRGEWFSLTTEDLGWIDSRLERPVPQPTKKGKTSIEKRIARARADVRSRIGQQRQIAKDLGVHYNWVRQFADGTLKEPGAIKFDHLEEWLKKHA